MAESSKILQAVLIKVRVGSEKEVRDWLLRMKEPPTARYCIRRKHMSRRCSFCTDAELDKRAAKLGGGDLRTTLPCEAMEVLVVAYLTGPFDFLLAAEVPSSESEEQFLVNCLRSGEIAPHILDTQTLAGIPYYSRGS